MKDLLILLAHLLTTIARLLGPGGAKAVVADSLIMKQQLLIINRSRQRAAGAATVTGGNTMLRNLSGLDNHQFNDFRRIQREVDELFGTQPAHSGTSDVQSCFFNYYTQSYLTEKSLSNSHQYSTVFSGCA
jgi:hypothetical protein